ncbi:hypothetical protein BDR04DRAFT_1164274 [Suillus decipiens]|nr:hypothetical protein BDR04DRAFT_1164274 [Suillus decipiens]
MNLTTPQQRPKVKRSDRRLRNATESDRSVDRPTSKNLSKRSRTHEGRPPVTHHRSTPDATKTNIFVDRYWRYQMIESMATTLVNDRLKAAIIPRLWPKFNSPRSRTSRRITDGSGTNLKEDKSCQRCIPKGGGKAAQAYISSQRAIAEEGQGGHIGPWCSLR